MDEVAKKTESTKTSQTLKNCKFLYKNQMQQSLSF